jgi:hypothetical protein
VKAIIEFQEYSIYWNENFKNIPMTMIIETSLGELGTRFNGGHHYNNFEHHYLTIPHGIVLK